MVARCFPARRTVRELARAEGLEPSRACAQRIFLPPAAFAVAAWRLWSGLSLHPRRSVARLVSTPSHRDRSIHPGLARDCHLTGFPDFEQFSIAGFPASSFPTSRPHTIAAARIHCLDVA